MEHNVLIVTYYWPPSGGPGVQRYLKFAKYLPRFGVRPFVLTVDNPTYPIRDQSLVREIPDGITVYKSKTIEPFGIYAGLSGDRAESVKPTIELQANSFRSALGSWIRANIFIPDARAGWLLTAKRKSEEIIRAHGISTVITTGPPHSVHFIGRHLQQKQQVRWLADFRDPWSRVYYNQLLPRTRMAEQVDEKLEKTVLKQADEVIVVSRPQAENFRKISERGYRVITNGFDPDDFKSIAAGPSLSPELMIRHIGNIGEAAVPDAFLKAVAEVSPAIKLNVEFIGHVHPRLHTVLNELGLEKSVSVKDYLPHRKALEKMCGADLLLLCIPDTKHMQHHIPGKFFEYLGSGRPVLVLGPEDGESARILREQEAGYTAEFNDIGKIKTALETFSKQAGRTISKA
ncbi:MAG: glycosyltransferase family 4 protein, partial [Balneolaceae bacterium]